MRCKFCDTGNLEWLGDDLRCTNDSCAKVWVLKVIEKQIKDQPGPSDGRCPTCKFPLDRKGYCPNCGWYRTKLRIDDTNVSELG